MKLAAIQDPAEQPTPEEVEALFQSEHQRVCKRTDRLISVIMCLQWPAAIAAAVCIAPKSWIAHTNSIHAHILTAIYLGGLITILPVAMAFLRPGEKMTRHIIAACQMLMSALLIYITGGRIETHFHVFGSLAFLAFYLDWPVLLTATIVTLVDYAGMGYLSSRDVLGPVTWRFLEYVLWVMFCDTFLVSSCWQSLAGLRVNAKREAYEIHQALHDALTGLGNRTLLEMELVGLLKKPLGQTQPFALIAIDLDQFKEVNDTLGHQVGDQLLVEVGQRLRKNIRPHDTLVRMGGDEFTILLRDCSHEANAEDIAARIVNCIRVPFQCEGHIVGIGASIGIALYPAAGKQIAELLHHADLALYKVKKKSRNSYQVFDEKMREEILREMNMEHRLRLAVETGGFEVHYQPLVSIKGALLGFEALLRWNDTVLGNVPPKDFIPIAEKTGLIIPLGKWVLKHACEQAAQWQRSGHRKTKIAVNVSSVQLAQNDFVSMVLSTLEETGLSPELVDLELTETVIIRNFAETRDKLALLRELGISLSIDDFGTGYSSLSYLRELRVDTVKIDRSLVTDIDKSAAARSLIEGIIAMTHSLDLKVLAEGVENYDQLNVLSRAGCDEIQGYYFSRPVPVEDANLMVQGSTCNLSAPARTEPSAPTFGILQPAII